MLCNWMWTDKIWKYSSCNSDMSYSVFLGFKTCRTWCTSDSWIFCYLPNVLELEVLVKLNWSSIIAFLDNIHFLSHEGCCLSGLQRIHWFHQESGRCWSNNWAGHWWRNFNLQWTGYHAGFRMWWTHQCLCGQWPILKLAHSNIVLTMIIYPLGQLTVTAGSDHCFHTCCPYVCPHFSRSSKTKQISSDNNVHYRRDCGPGRVDHWWHLSCHWYYSQRCTTWPCGVGCTVTDSVPS